MSKASLRRVFFSTATIVSLVGIPVFTACIDEVSNQLPGGGKGKGTGGSKGGGDADAGDSGSGGAGTGGAGSGGAVVGSGGDASAGGAEATGGAEQGTGGADTGTGGAVVEAGTPDGSAGDGGPEGGTPVTVSAPADLPDVSADDYKDNVHGIITGDTLKRWIADWTANRPAGVTGKLVVLQIVPGVAASVVHVAEKGTTVASYVVPASELTQVRDNGLSRIEAEIPNGTAADAFLKKYGIDAVNDYVVLTFEQLADTQNSIVQSVGRAWLLLRYWGYAKERIGILNGSVNWNATTHGLVNTTPQQEPPNNGTTTVRDLRVDNTAYVITLGGVLDVYKGAAGAVPLANVSLVDARGGAEALGLQKATSTGKTNCTSYTGTGVNARCSPPFEGRLKGANSVPWPQFLRDGANGFQFLSKADAKAIFDAQSHYTAGQLTIQYCRTNMRSMVTGLVANVVLGYPTRFYDTSFIEWSHLSYGPTALTRILPENSSYRTDLATLTQHADVSNYTPGGSIEGITINGWVDGPNYNVDADISPTPPAVTPTAGTTNLSVETDRAYKLQ
jgi:3-mercaptopyruvate sulfurtransferase SseA